LEFTGSWELIIRVGIVVASRLDQTTTQKARTIVIRCVWIKTWVRGVRTTAQFKNVTDAVLVFIGFAVTATHAKRVKLVAVAVAVASRDVGTSALEDLAWTIADAARVVSAHAVVRVVTNAIGIGVRSAVTATHAKRVKLVAVAVAIPCWDV
jgi:hypothetical protein